MEWERKMREEGPLALRMRPPSLDEFAGQSDLLGEGKPLRRLITADRVPSMIFSGPPGTGKTTLALIIASTTRAAFIPVSYTHLDVYKRQDQPFIQIKIS